LDRAFRENILPSDAAFARRLSVRKTASRKMDVEPDEASEAESLTEVPSRISDRQIPTTPALPPEPAALLPA
jgi:hypothetical protein